MRVLWPSVPRPLQPLVPPLPICPGMRPASQVPINPLHTQVHGNSTRTIQGPIVAVNPPSIKHLEDGAPAVTAGLALFCGQAIDKSHEGILSTRHDSVDVPLRIGGYGNRGG